MILLRVSVIISTYTKEHLNYVIDCIDSLKRQTVLPLEIILVLDPDEDLIKFYKSRISKDVIIFASDKKGLSNARNFGVEKAKGSIIAFIDDDAIADLTWIENLVIQYNLPKVIGVGGKIKPLWEDKRPSWFSEELDWIIGCCNSKFSTCKTEIRNPIGCNMSFRREVFEKIGFFKSQLGRFGKTLLAGEETDFSIRALKAFPNSIIRFSSSTIVYHRITKKRATVYYFLKRSFYEGVSKGIISSLEDTGVLSTENKYLEYLMKSTIPTKISKIYNLQDFSQLIVIFLSIFSVFSGFLFSKFSKKD
jgi:glycosyltransferase involved in cell wall biosynthesis